MARTIGSDGKQTRQKILTVVVPLLAKLGYAAVSMRMIAEEVGINASALYNHFPNKQSILVSVLSDHMDDLLEGIASLEMKDLTPSEQLAAFCRHNIQFNAIRQEAVFISYMELRSLEPENYDLIEAKRREYEHFLRRIIRNGVETEEFKVEDAHVAAMSILGSLTGFLTWFRKGGRLSKRKVAEYYVAMSLRTVGYSKVNADV